MNLSNGDKSTTSAHRSRGSGRRVGVGLIGCALAVGLVAAACSSSSKTSSPPTSGAAGSSSSSGPKGTPYYIGAELSLSGPFSSFEVPMLQGLEVAVQDINRMGGVLGHPVALDYQSDASDTTKVPLALQGIFSSDKVHRIVYMAPNVLPNITTTVLQYTEKYGIPSFDAGSGPNLFGVSTHPYNFSVYPANQLQVPAYVAAFENMDGSASAIKLGVLNDTEAADVTLAGQIMSATKQEGGTVVGQEQVDPAATDVSVQMQKLKNDGANIVLVQSSGNIPVEAAQTLEFLNWKTVKLLISPAAVNAHTQGAIPQAVASQVETLGETPYLRNAAGTGPDQKYQAFATELAATPGGIDDLEVSVNYRDTAVLDAWAINKAGTTDIKSVMNVLDNLAQNAPPSGLLIFMPNPKWTATDHTLDNSDFSTGYWALLKPGQEVQGTLQGQALNIPSNLAQLSKG